MEKNELHAVIKYLQKKGLTPQEIHDDMVGVLGDDAPSYQVVKNWSRQFRCGRKTCEHAKGAGRPQTVCTQENVNRVCDLIKQDRRLTTRRLAEITGLSNGTIATIINAYLGLHKVSARWVPRMLTPEQKRERVITSEANLALFNSNPKSFLGRFVTVDETWVHHFDPESKVQSKEWRHRGSPPPRKFRVQPSAGKIMATIFWDAEGILLIDYLERGQTITGQYYATLITQLRDSIKEKRKGKLSRGILFNQDNASVHKSLVALNAIHNAGFELMAHPPYSPDLAPSDFYLFPKLKECLRGNKFNSDDEVMTAVEEFFCDQNPEFFEKGITMLEHRWNKCLQVHGDYVEK